MRPKFEADSLLFQVSYLSQKDTVSVRMKSMDKDSLELRAVNLSLKPGTALLEGFKVSLDV